MTNNPRPVIRVVVLTLMNPSTPGVKAHISGVDSFIEKGAPLSELMEAIAN